jgi:hypothetical protein
MPVESTAWSQLNLPDSLNSDALSGQDFEQDNSSSSQSESECEASVVDCSDSDSDDDTVEDPFASSNEELSVYSPIYDSDKDAVYSPKSACGHTSSDTDTDQSNVGSIDSLLAGPPPAGRQLLAINTDSEGEASREPWVDASVVREPLAKLPVTCVILGM